MVEENLSSEGSPKKKYIFVYICDPQSLGSKKVKDHCPMFLHPALSDH
jgi:hypothetical protein